MTIAAGFVCSDGLVLCADTEMTGHIRSYGRKAWFRHEGEFSIALVGSGDAILIKLARNRLFERINTNTPLQRIKNDPGVDEILGATLRSIYEDHIDRAPAEWRANGYDLGILLGIRNKNGFALFAHSRTAPADVDRYWCEGTGAPLAQYLSETMFLDGTTVEYAATLACYVLQQCKTYSPYCGGESHVIVMPSSGKTRLLSKKELNGAQSMALATTQPDRQSPKHGRKRRPPSRG